MHDVYPDSIRPLDTSKLGPICEQPLTGTARERGRLMREALRKLARDETGILRGPLIDLAEYATNEMLDKLVRMIR